MASNQEKLDKPIAAGIVQGEKNDNPLVFSSPEPSTQDSSRHGDKEHQAQEEHPSPQQPILEETSKDFTTMPPGPAPEPFPEQNLPRPTSEFTNEFMNPAADKIPKESILALFPNEEAWKIQSTTARENSRLHRKAVMAQVLHLSCLKNCVLPELLHRGNLLAQATTFPSSVITQSIIDNQRAWITWAVSLNETITNVLKQINWLDLLEAEYVAADPLWTSFWRLHQEEVEQQQKPASADPPSADQEMPPPSATATMLELEEIYVRLANHNRRRLFLQMKMMDGRDWVARLFEELPPWIEWEEAVRAMLNAEAGRRYQDDESGQEQESGFVEEMEDEEEFEL
ncbi:uncharacterized protein Z520_10972 [Fonsecaea multimorphosa CBS 102226]|uniref:Uncharacterized protein n=1 Tax=Fonsecaea multimorphosa CBS 102226 TaxID=1442371 RepID=A0A0D2JSD0_9EURO|nr:uncharacterized protein Z520_10972 [Fonsecaea multimorphosa CBS 102226]KIX93329.1 hypothetical protein Z520_10972 [Fonsecaea multimorphosa CBS 102226]OAL18567.1 hypothetical protein AYO22_10544 [Fonsecaea multimorphosa]